MTGWDRFATAITLLWPLLFTVVFIVILVFHVQAGAHPGVVGELLALVDLPCLRCRPAAVTIWFTIGGFRDLRRMFKRLREYVADDADDGRVE